eukprot:1387105-Amphidinium_carterae.1
MTTQAQAEPEENIVDMEPEDVATLEPLVAMRKKEREHRRLALAFLAEDEHDKHALTLGIVRSALQPEVTLIKNILANTSRKRDQEHISRILDGSETVPSRVVDMLT